MLADLTTTNRDLAAQLAAKDTELAKLRAQLANRPNKPTRAPTNQTTRRYTNNNYCWTHGWDIADKHTGETCANPAEGHKKGATRANPMGGSMSNKNKVG